MKTGVDLLFGIILILAGGTFVMAIIIFILYVIFTAVISLIKLLINLIGVVI